MAKQLYLENPNNPQSVYVIDDKRKFADQKVTSVSVAEKLVKFLNQKEGFERFRILTIGLNENPRKIGQWHEYNGAWGYWHRTNGALLGRIREVSGVFSAQPVPSAVIENFPTLISAKKYIERMANRSPYANYRRSNPERRKNPNTFIIEFKNRDTPTPTLKPTPDRTPERSP